MFQQKTVTGAADKALRTRIADLAAAGVEVAELSDDHLPLSGGVSCGDAGSSLTHTRISKGHWVVSKDCDF
jgi:hypothetical protein